MSVVEEFLRDMGYGLTPVVIEVSAFKPYRCFYKRDRGRIFKLRTAIEVEYLKQMERGEIPNWKEKIIQIAEGKDTDEEDKIAFEKFYDDNYN